MLADALGVLDDLSLIDFEPETRTFSTHRIVQAAARDALAQDRENWAQRAVAVAFSAFPEPAQETWPLCARLVSHVRALHSHVPAEAATRELGWLLGASGEYSHERAALADVLPLFNASLAIAERLAKADPGNAGWQRDLSVSQEKIGDVLRAQGNLPAALDAFNASLAIRERLAKADPGNAGWQRDLSVSQDKIGDVLVKQGNLAEALDAFNASLAIAERLAKADPGNAGWQHDIALSLQRVGYISMQQGSTSEALDAYRRGLAIMQALVALAPDHAAFKRDLGWFEASIAEG
jgi:tetratricopeptide (TPR) repeat protein